MNFSLNSFSALENNLSPGLPPKGTSGIIYFGAHEQNSSSAVIRVAYLVSFITSVRLFDSVLKPGPQVQVRVELLCR